MAMSNRRGQKLGPQRGNRQRFPYEPRVVGGRLLMPAELQAIHRYVVETPVLKTVTEEIRAVVETVWPELRSKLPPKRRFRRKGRGVSNTMPQKRAALGADHALWQEWLVAERDEAGDQLRSVEHLELGD